MHKLEFMIPFLLLCSFLQTASGHVKSFFGNADGETVWGMQMVVACEFPSQQ